MKVNLKTMKKKIYNKPKQKNEYKNLIVARKTKGGNLAVEKVKLQKSNLDNKYNKI
jgi:cell division protein FtsL